MKYYVNFLCFLSIFYSIDALSESWNLSRNEHGVVLKSENRTLYLGKDCDAMSPGFGEGRWFWSDNELFVDIANYKTSFNIEKSLYTDGRCAQSSNVTEVSNDIGSNRGCSSVDIENEKLACYVLTVGPKACSQAISENNPSFASSISERVSLSAACTAVIKTSYAEQYVPNDFIWNITDELLETGCSKMTNDDSSIITKVFVGFTSCVSNAVLWANRLDAASACARKIEQRCEH